MFSWTELRNMEGRALPFYNFSSEHGGKVNMLATTSAPAVRSRILCAAVRKSLSS